MSAERTSTTTGGNAAGTLATRDVEVELAARETVVTLPLGEARERVLAVARDASRSLVLRVENIAVEGQPGVYEVRVDGAREPSGVLSFYGAETQNGRFVAAFVIDDAVRAERGELRIVFTPAGPRGEGRARFSRLVLTSE